MAKKTNQKNERKAVVEQLRKEQARSEKRRSTIILMVCIAVVVGLLVAALIPYFNNRAEQARINDLDLADFGVSESAAKCDPVKSEDATGSNDHRPSGEKIDYPAAPPAFGPHDGNFLQGPEIRNFYDASDRPPLERMVHSLEHGYTLVWYDTTKVKEGSATYKTLDDLAKKLPDAGSSTKQRYIALPWTKADGAAFPEGKEIALTHWTGPQTQQGKWRYCGKVSGAVVGDFMKEFPASDAPEPGAI